MLPSCLSDSVSRGPVGTEAEVASISSDSRYVLYNYAYTQPTNDVGYEIFDTACGKLTSIFSGPSNSDDGYVGATAVADPSFSMLFVVDSNLQNLRVRIGSLNYSGNSVVYTVTNTFYVSGVPPPDSAVAVVTYINGYVVILFNKADGNYYLAAFTAYQQIMAPSLVVTVPSGKTLYSNAIPGFCINGVTYVAFATIFAGVTVDNTVTQITAPSYLNIYAIGAVPTQVARVQLPQYGNWISVYNGPDYANIAVSLRATYLPGQPSLFTDTSNQMSLDGQIGNLRVYKFDGCNISLIACVNLASEVVVGGWHPNGLIIPTFYDVPIANLNPPVVFNYLQLPNLTSVGYPVMGPPGSFSSSISPDGKKLFVGGYSVTGFNNIVLYT